MVSQTTHISSVKIKSQFSSVVTSGPLPGTTSKIRLKGFYHPRDKGELYTFVCFQYGREVYLRLTRESLSFRTFPDPMERVTHTYTYMYLMQFGFGVERQTHTNSHRGWVVILGLYREVRYLTEYISVKGSIERNLCLSSGYYCVVKHS